MNRVKIKPTNSKVTN